MNLQSALFSMCVITTPPPPSPSLTPLANYYLFLRLPGASQAFSERGRKENYANNAFWISEFPPLPTPPKNFTVESRAEGGGGWSEERSRGVLSSLIFNFPHFAIFYSPLLGRQNKWRITGLFFILFIYKFAFYF